MRVLLSTIGTRGEVQPLLALALALRARGHEVRACVPPDFREWLEGTGIPVVPIGPALRATAAPDASLRRSLATPEGRRALAAGSVNAQFEAVPEAGKGCDLVVGCGALQIAAPSAAELLGVPYVHAHFCPITLPSPHHPPPRLPGWDVDETASFRAQWEADARRWSATWGDALNARRLALGLEPVDDVRSHAFTARPWLAADPVLAPWPEPDDPGVVQTGAWLLPDERPLPEELEAFLEAGDPPVYFGLGSMAAPGADVTRRMVDAARAVGRRAILSRGWADLGLPDDGPDCISVGDTNHRALLPRVAAVVHHGGAGTTTVAAGAGVPQVVVPQRYDQPYWAARVEALGLGLARTGGVPTADSLADALRRALEPEVVSEARRVAALVSDDGARIAAEGLEAVTTS